VRFAPSTTVATTAFMGYWAWWPVRLGERSGRDYGPLISFSVA